MPRALRLKCARLLGKLAAYLHVDPDQAEELLETGAIVKDAECIAQPAAHSLCMNKPERAIELFEVLLKELGERELYVSAITEENKWEAYRFYLNEEKEGDFMRDVRTGRCSPRTMKKGSVEDYGQLMIVERHP